MTPILLTVLAVATGASAQVPAPVQKAPFEQKIPASSAAFKMVSLPDGTSTRDGKTRTIKNLWMSETEVTWDVYDIYAFRLDQTTEEQAKGVDATSRPSKPYGAVDRGFGHAGFPALAMTFSSAEEFCRWLSAKTGKKYRLPTEQEWEFAASFGDEPKDPEPFAWFWDNAEDATKAVATKKPNKLGIYDLFGNVAEWVTVADQVPVVKGGSWKDKKPALSLLGSAMQEPSWNHNDPQNPKSKWWLANAPFVGIRLVCEGG